ncbi:unnamed protein product [Moneuplotes crassus]|uniref:Uncharacterized protein n=1 Tax=Euplotes crassus TaxID=5936 RepID=A0AAD1XXV7_EUPCR|nr:unnamed protein product [Moneuplotes crassus]
MSEKEQDLLKKDDTEVLQANKDESIGDNNNSSSNSETTKQARDLDVQIEKKLVLEDVLEEDKRGEVEDPNEEEKLSHRIIIKKGSLKSAHPLKRDDLTKEYREESYEINCQHMQLDNLLYSGLSSGKHKDEEKIAKLTDSLCSLLRKRTAKYGLN